MQDISTVYEMERVAYNLVNIVIVFEILKIQ